MRTVPKWVNKIHEADKVEFSSVHTICFSPDGTQLVVGAGEKVMVYDPRDGSLVQLLQAHKGAVHAVAYCSDGKKFASGSADKNVIIWTSKMEGVLKYSHSEAIQCLAYNPITLHLASCAMSDFAFWSADVKAVQKYRVAGRITSCAWSHTGQHLAIGLASGGVSIRDKVGDEVQRIARDAAVWAVAFSKSTLLVCDWNEVMSFYNIQGQQIYKERNIGLAALSLTMLGSLVMVGGVGGWAVLTAEGIPILDTEQEWVWSVAPSPSMNTLAVACRDGTLWCYQVVYSTVHGLYRERYAYRENMTDVIIQHLTTGNKVRIKCHDRVQKIAIYKHRLAVQLPERVVVYEQGDVEGMLYRVREKLSQKTECSLLVATSDALLLCQDTKLVMIGRRIPKSWTVPAAIRYVKVTTLYFEEVLLLGLLNGQIWQVEPCEGEARVILQTPASVRCLDVSASRSRLAVVDEASVCRVYSLPTGELLYTTEQPRVLIQRCVRAKNNASLPPSGGITRRKQFELKFNTGRYRNRVRAEKTLRYREEPLLVIQCGDLLAPSIPEAYAVACLGVTPLDWERFGVAALEELAFEVARKAFQRSENIIYLTLIDHLQEYHGPLLGTADVEDLQNAAADKMDKLNAAVALYLTAYADPKNTDYAAAVTSINTMNELLPELVKDGKALSSVKDGKNREELLDAIRTLCDAMKNVCLAADPDDHQKMHDDVKEYSKISDRLLFTFRRGRSVDKQNEIIELAKVAGEKASLLLMKANELTGRVPDAEAAMLDDAGVRCADAAQDLITCATLTAPSIHEPHCQSALTAAAEALSSSAQHLAVTWKPLVEDPARKEFGEDLRDRTMDLAKALDKLKGAFAGLDGVEEEPNEVRANRRLKFVTSVADAKNRMDAAEAELDAVTKPIEDGPKKQTEEELRRRLAQRMAQLNAALAALVAASADRDKPDYTTAEIAVSTIGELMPDIVKDGKLLSANANENAREQMLAELRALCNSTRAIYYSADSGDMDDLNKLASKVGASSGRLCFKFNPYSGRGQEQQILDLASSANDKASQLLDEVAEVVKKLGGQAGTELETARLKMADAAGALQTAAQLTAPSIQDPRCQASLVSSANALAASSQHLAAAWALQPGLQKAKTLEELRMQLERQLEALKKACQDTGIVGAEEPDETRAAPRLRFVTTLAAAKDKVKAAQAEIDQPVTGGPQKQTEEELRRRLAQRMAQLNAALAALVAASADRSRPDYAAAEQAVAAIADVMPEIVQDGKLLSAGKNDKAGEEMRAELRALCDHAGAVCGSSASGNLDDLNRLASTLAASSGKLLFTFKPTAGRGKERQILAMSSSVNDKVSQLLAGVQELAQQVHGPPRTELDAARLKAADAAQGLHTTAQLTAPCLPDPRCQASLVSSANALSSSSQQLASHWVPLGKEPRLAHLAKDLEDQRLQLERELDRLKKACVDTDAQPFIEPSQGRELQRLQFLKSVAAAETQLQAAENELKKPAVPPKVAGLSQEPAAPAPRLTLTRLAALHAAIAALAHAAADRENPDYAAADKAINDINQLLPQIVKEAKSQNLDEKARSARIEDLKAMCEAARGLLAAARTDQDLNNSAVKLATASGKFLGSYDTPAEQDREQRILDLSSSACEKASRLLSGVHQLAAEAGGEAGGQLDSAGSQLADRANSLLTTAQITAPCFEDAECRSILQSSTESVQEASKRLAFTWKPLVQDPRFQTLGADLERARQELEKELEELKKACQLDDCGLPPPEDESPLQKKRRLEFTRTAATAGDNLLQIVKDLDKPTLLQGVPPPHLQSNLARSLAQLNAAVAALLTATHDPAKPDYDAAEQAIHQINILMPQVVKDTKTLSANKDPEVRDAMLFDVKAMCEAARGVCQAAANQNKQLSTKHVASFANSSGKLSHAVSPRPAAASQAKEREIMELTSLVCGAAAGHVRALPPLGAQAPLQAASAAAASAAHALRDNAKLTAANIQEPCCRAALLSSIAAVSSSAQTLAGLWTPITQEPRHAAIRLQLNKEKKGLEEAVEKLKAAVLEDGPGAKPPMRKAPPLPPKRASAHDMPQAHAHAHADHQAKRDFNQEFLDQIRSDETRAANEAAFAAEAQKKKEAERQLVAAVDSAVQRIQKAEDHITKVYSSTGGVIPGVPVQQALALQKHIEARLAAAARAAAELLASDQSDFDYAAASKATTALSEQMPNIVKDANSLRGAMTEGERKLFLEDMLAMFDAAKVLVGASKHDHKRINESAIAFGNKSEKLLYVVSTDIDPAQKKEVLSLVRIIGDGACHLSARGEASPSPPVAGAAAALADAARTLMYSAQLLAPTVQIPECSESLIHASEDVAQKLRKYTTTFETLEKVDSQASATFSSESKKLEGLLRSFQEDLRSGKLVKRRMVERIVVEDTPLRQLAYRIIEDAKSRAETPCFPESQRRAWAAHANRLTQAAAALERACHAARRAPADANKRLALENAVQELQVLVLMSRPSLDATQNNIVDLTDYVRAVSDDADILLKECKEGQPESQMVKEHCERIKDNAARVMNPYLQSPVDAPEDDRGDVAQFAEDCEKRMKTINSIIQELKDGKTKIDLLEKAARLVETTNLLNFATQSDVATTKSVALDAALEELEDLKTGLEDMLTAGGTPARKRVSWSDAGSSRLIAAASRRDAGPRAMAPAFAVYLGDMRANRDLSDPDQRQRAKEHLDKVLQLLQTLTMTSGRHVATWQHTNHPETAAITEQIVKELDDYRTECNGYQKSVLSVNLLTYPETTAKNDNWPKVATGVFDNSVQKR